MDYTYENMRVYLDALKVALRARLHEAEVSNYPDRVCKMLGAIQVTEGIENMMKQVGKDDLAKELPGTEHYETLVEGSIEGVD